MAQIDGTIATYLTAIEVEGKTQNTVLSYGASLEDFRRVARRLGFPQQLEAYSVEHVYRFLGDLKQRGASTVYRHRRHREVKTFFSWCRRMDYVADNVFAKVPLVKLDQQIRPPFSPDEIQRLLGSLDQTDLPGCRNHAVILFLLDTGVRVSECVSIRLDDVDWERRRVLVRETKNKHDRWVGFGERTAQAMRDYVERFRGDRPGELFLTAAREPMASGNTVRVMLRRIAAQLGLEKVHPHRFRHTFATWAIQSGAREIDVQMLLGHSDLAMVQRYSRTYTSEQAVRAHAGLSPVGQLEPVGIEGDATEHPVPPAVAGPAEDQTLDLLSSPDRVSHVVPRRTDRVSPDASPTNGKAETMATTKERDSRRADARRQVQEAAVQLRGGRARRAAVLRAAQRPRVQEPLGGGQGGHRHGHQRLPLLVDPRPAALRPGSAPAGGAGGRKEGCVAVCGSARFPGAIRILWSDT